MRVFRLLILALVIPPTVGFSAAKQPNLLFILADDLGYGDLGCYGCPDIRTPRLDRLAVEGARLTDAYANGPTCSPTRYAFLTGRYQQRGGLEYALNYQEQGAGLPPGVRTLATRLQQAGYETALIGKWHLGYGDGRQPTAQGFDSFFGLLGGNHHYFEHMDRIGVPDLYRDDRPFDEEGYSTDLFTAEAIRFLRDHRDGPFFLYLAYNAPHFPYQGPDDADRLVEPKKASWQEGSRANYVSMVEHLDQGVGQVLDELHRLELDASTLVVFTSDNGGDPMGRNLPLAREKGTVWEGGIRVPCLARWPGRIPAGVESPQVAVTFDWSATLLELAGAPTDGAELDGINLLPLLKGDNSTVERTLCWRRVPEPVRGKVQPERAIRQGDWKLIDRPDGSRWLFHLSSDIGEADNLSAEHPALVSELQRALDSWEAEMPPSNPPTATATAASRDGKRP